MGKVFSCYKTCRKTPNRKKSMIIKQRSVTISEDDRRAEEENFLNDSNLDLDLETCDNTIPWFSMEGKRIGKVVNIYDGDTFYIVFRLNNKFQKFKVRCYGYNSPEMKPLLIMKNRDEEIKRANLAKDALSNQILNKIVVVDCLKFGKYGRIIGKVYYHGKYINEWMINNGYGEPYMRD